MRPVMPSDEAGRLNALQSYQILDTEQEREYDDFAFWATQMCQTPIALISFVDSRRLWFKSKVGTDMTEIRRHHTFCAQAILGSEVIVVSDAKKDERFLGNQLVWSEPFIRFYAGAPLIDSKGFKLGTLCVLDYIPRELNSEQISALQSLSHQIVRRLELRKASSANEKSLRNFLSMCSCCRKIKGEDNSWHDLDKYFSEHFNTQFGYGVCPQCRKEKSTSEDINNL